MKENKEFGNSLSPLVAIASTIIIVAGIMSATSIIIPVLLALFIGVVVKQPILWLEKRKVPDFLAIFIVLLGVLFLFILLGGLIGNSFTQFSQAAPEYAANLKGMTVNLITRLDSLGFNVNSDQFLSFVDPGKILNFTAGALNELGGLLSDSFLIMLITIFILMEANSFAIKSEVIQKTHNFSLKYMTEIGKSIRHYLSIKTVVSLLTGFLISIWLLIIGVDYPVLWGVLAFLLNFIPNIGSIIAALPTMLLALVQLGVGGMLWTGLGFLVVNMVIGNFVEPRIMGKGLGLSTLVVFLSLIVWGFIFGSVGMFLSVPLTMAIKISLEQQENTRWIALLLGTGEDSQKVLNKLNNEEQ